MAATFVIATFRSNFPEFANTTDYPDAQITFWAALAQKQVLPEIWKDVWIYGVSLYVAHEIQLARQNAVAGKIGGVPGTSGGIANSKTVGGVSVSYDSASTSYEGKNAAFWNLTNYGKLFYQLIRVFGAGAIQL